MIQNLYGGNKNSGFTLVELMVVIAIIAISVAVAIPMYGNYTIRAKIGSEIEKLGSVKAIASGYISNNNGSINYTIDNFDTLPSGTSIGDNGALILDTSDIIEDSSISLIPNIDSVSIKWSCSAVGFTNSQLPRECQSSNKESNNNEVSVVNQLESSNYFMGEACDSNGSASCYTYGDNQVIRIEDNGITVSYTFEGAATAESLDGQDSFIFSYNTRDNRLGAGSPEDLQGEPDQQQIWYTMDDFENSNLSDDEKQQVRDTINVIKEIGYCDSHSYALFC